MLAAARLSVGVVALLVSAAFTRACPCFYHVFVVCLSHPHAFQASVDGHHTNVSLSRFLRLFETARVALASEAGEECDKPCGRVEERASGANWTGDHVVGSVIGKGGGGGARGSLAMPLLLRFLWELSDSKQVGASH